MEKALQALVLTMVLMLTLTACGQDSSSSPPPDGENPLSEAESAFEYAISDFTETQNDLQNNISNAESLIETVSDSDVTDPTLLSDLRSLLEKAFESADAVTPTMESEADEIQSQVQDITEQTNDLWDLSYEISNAVSAIQYSQQEMLDAKQMEGLAAQEVLVSTIETTTGYRVEYTVCLTSWIRGSESESLQLAWKGVGGTDDIPSNLYDNRSAVAFGTISYRNVTEGFDISEDYPLDLTVSVDLDRDTLFRLNKYPTFYIQYASESKTTELGNHWSYTSVGAHMIRNTWGPNHFMIVCSNAYVPNAPDGIEALADFTIRFDTLNYAKVPTT